MIDIVKKFYKKLLVNDQMDSTTGKKRMLNLKKQSGITNLPHINIQIVGALDYTK